MIRVMARTRATANVGHKMMRAIVKTKAKGKLELR